MCGAVNIRSGVEFRGEPQVTPGHAGGAAIAAALALIAGCTTPIGVNRLRPEEANRRLVASVLTTGEPSDAAREYLYRLNLTERYAKDPAGTLALLRNGLGQADEANRLFALAELSFAPFRPPPGPSNAPPNLEFDLLSRTIP